MGKKKGAKWTDVSPEDPSAVLLGSGEGGFVSLEEIEEYPSLSVDLADPNQVKSKKKRKKKRKHRENTEAAEEDLQIASCPRKKQKTSTEEVSQEEIVEIPEWNELRIHPLLLKALVALGFKRPTPIQKACIPAAAHKGKDIIGAAETGSGKTLAFGIPILQRLLDEREKLLRQDKEVTSGPLRALIVTPTRELALQICDHIRAVAKFTDYKIAPIVGGISPQKQQRLLKQRPAIVVGTPGRLWELLSEGESHLIQLEELSFFILDEADRMVEKGHFKELQSIIDFLPKTRQEKPEEETDTAESITFTPKKRRQTLVFSATLTLPSDFKKKLKKGAGAAKFASQYSVAVLSEKAGISHNSEVVDLTSKAVVAEKLTESVVECREEDRDAYLYYVLKVHGCGRTIVFCTSISSLRRLASNLRLLEIPAWPLHAQLQQRQRLKTMDRFRSEQNGVLVATDVAARGLDIPGVRTVIHYQLPHNAEMYVHRSGRTARADKDGCSIALISPSEKTKYITLCRALSKTGGLTSFPVDPAYIPSVQKRVSLAFKIDKLLREQSQTKAKSTWLEQHAKELEIDLDEKHNSDEDSKGKQRRSLELKKLQDELKQMLKHPLVSKGFSRRYVTGTGLTPLAAKQLKEYAENTPGNRLVVIGQQETEPLQALKAQKH